MEYMSIKQASEKWNISERMLQKYCALNRIEGAKKTDGRWTIPLTAEDPRINRQRNKMPSYNAKPQSMAASSLMPLMNSSFKPGTCLDYIEKMEPGTQKDIAKAEFYYFSGHPEQAAEICELYMASENEGARLSAFLIYAYSNLAIGHINQTRYALNELSRIFSSESNNTEINVAAAKSFVASAASVLLHLPLPDNFTRITGYLPLLPPGVRAFAFYVQAHYTYLQKDYGKSIGITETTLAMLSEMYPIPAIYLHLVAVMDYMSLKQPEKAKEHLLAAWEIAMPDGLIEGFGEHHGLLGGMLESVIKKSWPDEFKKIINITYRFSAGWRKIHNPTTGEDVADNLTTTEFAIAMLAARGWTNQEIGEHLNISPNTVKQYISVCLHKLNISRRQDLKNYMLK